LQQATPLNYDEKSLAAKANQDKTSFHWLDGLHKIIDKNICNLEPLVLFSKKELFYSKSTLSDFKNDVDFCPTVILSTV